jgi:hypothetical protein
MPVAVTQTTSLIGCQDQNKIAPTVSRYYDNLVLNRMRSVVVQAGQQARIQWTLVDPNGVPVDLTGCGFPDGSGSSYSSQSSAAAELGIGFKFRIRENLSLGISPKPLQTEFPVYLVDASAGKVEIVLDKRATNTAGVYFGELGVFTGIDTDDELMIFSNVFYVIINQGQFGASRWNGAGPPTIQEIRLHLRDSGPEENLLLDNIKFDDAEIGLAISRPVSYWNEIPPDLGQRFTTQNFPFRFHWLEAICANLFWMVAENFRANNLQYSAAGVQVNDQNKEPNYEQAADRRNRNWLEFVRRKKAEINMNMAFSRLGSPYKYVEGNYYSH